VLERLTKRRDFLAAARGRRSSEPSLVLQAWRRAEEPPGTPRVGFTVTRKVGSAVERNRIRRRFRAAMREIGPGLARPGHDYVIVGRRGALKVSYPALLAELGHAFHVVHGAKGSKRAAGPKAEGGEQRPDDHNA